MKCVHYVIATCASMLLPWSLHAEDLKPRAVAEVKREQPIGFASDILPLLKRNCLACHHAKDAEGGLVLETHASMVKGGESGAGIVPGKSSESLVFLVAASMKDPVMPPEDNTVGAKPFTAEELGLLKLWIDQGAPIGSTTSDQPLNWQPLAESLQPIYSVAVSPDGQYIAAGRGNQVKIYHHPTRSVVGSLIDPKLPLLAGQTEPKAADLDVVQSIAFSPDGERIVTGGFRTVRIWKRAGEPQVADAPEWIKSSTRSAATVDASLVAEVMGDHSIEIWNAVEKKKVQALPATFGPVQQIVWSVDGQRVVVQYQDGHLVVWDPANTTPVAQLEATPKALNLAASNQAEWIVGVDEGRKLQSWQLMPAAEGSTERKLEAKPMEAWGGFTDVSTIGVVPGKAPLWLVGLNGGQVHLCELNGGKTVRTVEHGGALKALAVSTDGQQLATAGSDGSIKLWSTENGKLKTTFASDGRSDRELLIAQRDQARQKALADRLAAKKADLEKAAKNENDAKDKVKAGRDKAAEALAAKVKSKEAAQMALTDVEKAIEQARNEMLQAQKAAEEAAKKMEMMMGQIEGKKKAIETAEGERTKAEQELSQHDQTLAAAAQAAERAAQAIPAHESVIAEATKKATEMQQRVEEIQKVVNQARAVPVSAVSFSRDSQQLIAAYETGAIRVYRESVPVPEQVYDWPGTRVEKLVTTKEGTLLADVPGAPVKSLALSNRWILETTIGSPTDSPISDRVTSLEFSRDGKSVYVGSGPPSRFGELKRFEVPTGKMLHDYGQIHSDTVLGIEESPDGKLLATCSADKTVRITNLASGERLRTMEGHTHHVLSIAWQDTCETLVSASADGNVKVWDVASGEQRRTIAGASKEVTAIAFVGQTSQLIAAQADAQIRLLETTNGQAVRTFGGAKDFQFAVAVTDDASTVFVGGQDGVLRVWKIANAELLHQYTP